MALSPLSLSGIANFQNLNNVFASNTNTTNTNNDKITASSGTSVEDDIQLIKDNSLLYQLISRLLLSSEQDKQLADSLAQTTVPETTSSSIQSTQLIGSELEININSAQFTMKIEISMFSIQQQTLTITDQFGSFTHQQTVVEAFSLTLEISMNDQVQESDPLIIDLNGDGFTTTGIEQGAIFDINGDGILDLVSVTASDDAFLALDINGNGLIDNGTELFGDQTGFSSGFSYLKSFDDNNDQLIDAKDKVFNDLLLMRLVDNQQFITELSATNIKSIDLAFVDTAKSTSKGDRIVQISNYQNSNGQKGVIADLLLKYKSGIS